MTANLRILTNEKRESPMKRLLMPATTVAAVLMLVLFAPAIALSQQLQSGALLTIKSNDGLVNRAVYDSQIHSLNVQAPLCGGLSIVTDAYVLQGGSPTGCDPGDNYEVTTNTGTHQSPGNATIIGNGYSFTIQTFYLCGYTGDGGCPSVSVPPYSSPTMPLGTEGRRGFCNTNNTICTGPDTGFLAVTLNSVPTGTTFAGTISLTGNALNIPSGNEQYCPTAAGGAASDMFNSNSQTLVVGSTWVFALSPDSSNCGGFTQSQTQTLTAGGTVKFPFGPNETGPGPLPGADYILTGINNVGGEIIKFDLVPVLQGGNLGTNSDNTFSAGPSFPGFTCDPYGDLSETGNPVCAEVHLGCTVGEGAPTNDCASFIYTVITDYTNSAGAAGNALLQDDTASSCASNSWDANIFLSVTVDEIKKKGGGGPASGCFVAANGVKANGQPADLITQGQTFVSFEGLEFPFTLTPPKINHVIPGLIAPLTFDEITPNLTNATFSAKAIPINCSTRVPTPSLAVPLSGNLVNLTKLAPKLFPVERGLTEYVFNWLPAKGSTGCVSIEFAFQNGPFVVVAQQFKYGF